VDQAYGYAFEGLCSVYLLVELHEATYDTALDILLLVLVLALQVLTQLLDQLQIKRSMAYLI
jgi:hypothetical protein